MKIISDFIKNLGFTFSIRRLKKAIILVLLFSFIGIGVYLFFKYESSDEGLKRMYINEVSKKYDLKDNKIIDIEKKDVNNDKIDDYVFIIGKEVRSDSNSLNSIVELYDVSFVIVDGNTNEEIVYETQKDYKPEVTLNMLKIMMKDIT